MKSWRSIPLYQYQTFEDFFKSMPFDCRLIGVELDSSSVPIKTFSHPERCIYLLGAEDNGLTKEAIGKCHQIVQLPGDYCMNVAVTGSLVMFDRLQKGQ